MKYTKPEIIEIDHAHAVGVRCDWGYTNYSSGCTRGFSNAVNCGAGTAFFGCSLGSGFTPGCQFGLAATPVCSVGFFVSP